MALLIVMSIGMQIGFATWRDLLNNFAVDMAQFTGADIGIVQSLREIPGLLAVTAILFLLVFREQKFAIASLMVPGLTFFWPRGSVP